MREEQDRKRLMNDIKRVAIDFAYENFTELKSNEITLDAKSCQITEIVHQQQFYGPGEALDVTILNENWQVMIPVKEFSQYLIIEVSRYPDSSLSVSSWQSMSFR